VICTYSHIQSDLRGKGNISICNTYSHIRVIQEERAISRFVLTAIDRVIEEEREISRFVILIAIYSVIQEERAISPFVLTAAYGVIQ